MVDDANEGTDELTIEVATNDDVTNEGTIEVTNGPQTQSNDEDITYSFRKLSFEIIFSTIVFSMFIYMFISAYRGAKLKFQLNLN